MKQCPKCKAELDDNARFCLYCMTSLDEKTQIPQPVRKRRLWPFVLGFAVLVLCATLIWRLIPPTQPSMETPEEAHATPQTTPSSLQTEAAGTTTGTQPQQNIQSGVVAIPDTGPTVQTVPTQTTTPVATETTGPTAATKPTETTAPVPTPQPTETTAATTQPTQATEAPESTMPPNTAVLSNGVVYTYRERTADELKLLSWLPRYGVVITGVSVPHPDGIYEVHSKMDLADGSTLRISGVDSYAFAGTNAKIISLSSLAFVHENAFYGCPLTHLYISDGLCFHKNACAGCPEGFKMVTLGTTTEYYLHDTFNFCADYFGAVWEEGEWVEGDWN